MKKLLFALLTYSVSFKLSAQLFEVKGKNYLTYKSIDSTVSFIQKEKLFVKADTILIKDHFLFHGQDIVKYYYDSSGKLLKARSSQVKKDTSAKNTYYYRNNKPIKIIAEIFIKNNRENFAAYYLDNRGAEIYSRRDYDVSDLGDYYRSAKIYLSRFMEIMLKSKVN